MKKNLKILVATDYSEAVMNAEHYAVQLACREGVFLRFLHVFEPPGANQTGAFDAKKIDYVPGAYELNKLKDHVKKIVDSMGCKPGEVQYECLVREGNPADQIVQEVKETFPDFVLMGTHGGSGFREFVLGTQTWKVIKKAGVPVFALPKDAYYTGIKKIVYATEYREGELPVVNYISQLAQRFGASLTVLHITDNLISEETEKKISAEFMDQVANRVEYQHVDLRVEHATDVLDGIEDYMERSNGDLLVMSHEKPYFLERIFNPGSSRARKMALHTEVPLLVVPDYYNPDFAWFWRLFALDYSMDTDF